MNQWGFNPLVCLGARRWKLALTFSLTSFFDANQNKEFHEKKICSKYTEDRVKTWRLGYSRRF